MPVPVLSGVLLGQPVGESPQSTYNSGNDALAPHVSCSRSVRYLLSLREFSALALRTHTIVRALFAPRRQLLRGAAESIFVFESPEDDLVLFKARRVNGGYILIRCSRPRALARRSASCIEVLVTQSVPANSNELLF